MRRLLAALNARLLTMHARNALRLAIRNHQTPGHPCVTTRRSQP